MKLFGSIKCVNALERALLISTIKYGCCYSSFTNLCVNALERALLISTRNSNPLTEKK